MKIETKLEIRQDVYLLDNNTIVDAYVVRITATKFNSKCGQGEESPFYVEYQIKRKGKPDTYHIREDEFEEEELYINREDCRKALILKVMEM
ncbi:MAG: hypothetical protein E3J23_08495 [Candidatus Stahlbacteria bacterium]|nr:MAG: hypothetical protein E3J23_08495 [Candidatus Stahlbacteria bacterium]